MEKPFLVSPKITIFTPTHVDERSFKELPACVESFRKNVVEYKNCRHMIVCDSDPALGGLVDDYLTLLKSIEDKYPEVEVIHRPNSGLRKNYMYALENIDTPYLFFLEHDWVFLKEINLETLLSVFENHSKVNYIRFNRKNNSELGGWDSIREDASEITETPLLKQNAWHNHVHIIRVSEFIQNRVPLIDTWSIETSLTNHFHRQINFVGFEEAHSKWGTYLYGEKDSDPVVRNIGILENDCTIGHRVLQFRDRLEK